MSSPFSDLLSDCPVCSASVSRLAPTCPHCGHPINLLKSPHETGTTITGIDLPFREWVNLMIKIYLASIPAVLVAGVFVWLILSMMGIF